ncbi:MAG: DNA methyltransferase [Thermoplasmata archaeon]
MKNEKLDVRKFENYLRDFVFSEGSEGNMQKRTVVKEKEIGDVKVRYYVNEFWTSRQRQGSSIHEISYRACFKPQLPAFFISALTNEGDIVFDPFSGRGTTVIEAVLRGRLGYANDVNPLSQILAEPRVNPPKLKDIEYRLEHIQFDKKRKSDIDLSMFYHEDTLGEILSLREYLQRRKEDGKEDKIDKWIRMVATNRLTGHSKGFFSVYTLPPNQAVSQTRQIKINERRGQVPEYRDVKNIIKKKSKQLLSRITNSELSNIEKYGKDSKFFSFDARDLRDIDNDKVQLTVTSPPFLDVVQYSKDNWLRCWFNCIDDKEVSKRITMVRTLPAWEDVMFGVFKELYRITREGGLVAFEVGEVKRGKIMLEERIVPIGGGAGFKCVCVVINAQQFTKTANIWGIDNNVKGTNTNRIVIFRKD